MLRFIILFELIIGCLSSCTVLCRQINNKVEVVDDKLNTVNWKLNDLNSKLTNLLISPDSPPPFPIKPPNSPPNPPSPPKNPPNPPFPLNPPLLLDLSPSLYLRENDVWVSISVFIFDYWYIIVIIGFIYYLCFCRNNLQNNNYIGEKEDNSTYLI